MTMRGIWMGIVLALAAPVACAAEASGHDQVLERIILIRHGIRSPTKAPADLAKYAAEPWPSWPVAPGQLTPHGIATLRSLGQRMGKDLTAAGLPSDACGGTVHVIADSTPRNRASAEALLGGLSPQCTAKFQAFPAGQDDPLFRGVGGEDDDKGGIDAAAVDATTRRTLANLQQVLLGCLDDACLKKAQDAGKQVLLGGDVAKALKTAGSLAENIMLAYVEGMPEGRYGWGRLDAAGVARIITLHNTSFKLAHATPETSRGRGGNMLAHITATLAQAAGQPTTVNPLAPPGTRVVILIGHDTDLAAQAGLLGLDWHAATKGDDFPPGGALIYDLVSTRNGKAVSISIAMPTLAALRAGDMAGDEAVVRKPLAQTACHRKTSCPLGAFMDTASTAAGAAVASAGNEPNASSN
jgi:4-phytase / acid phosphatase